MLIISETESSGSAERLIEPSMTAFVNKRIVFSLEDDVPILFISKSDN